MRKRRLFTPGPTPLLPEVQAAACEPVIHHRTKEFSQLLMQTCASLQELLETSRDIVILACSGTGAMEAAVSNLLSRGDTALAVVTGKFGRRWVELCRAFKVHCPTVEKPWGQAAQPEDICRELNRRPVPKALLIQACETSTGTVHDLEAIAKRVGREFPEVLLIVDAISALGCQRLATDAWGLDIVIGASQKSFGMSPGLAFMSLSPRALQQMKLKTTGRFYFNLVAEAQKQRRGQTSFTPAVSLVSALHASTRAILDQGPSQVLAESALMARATQAGLTALGFELVSDSPANALTAVYPPPGIDAGRLIPRLDQRFGLQVAGGQGPLKTRILRVAHLGFFDLLDVFSLLSAVELTLLELGHGFVLGTGINAALHETATASGLGEERSARKPKGSAATPI